MSRDMTATYSTHQTRTNDLRSTPVIISSSLEENLGQWAARAIGHLRTGALLLSTHATVEAECFGWDEGSGLQNADQALGVENLIRQASFVRPYCHPYGDPVRVDALCTTVTIFPVSSTLPATFSTLAPLRREVVLRPYDASCRPLSFLMSTIFTWHANRHKCCRRSTSHFRCGALLFLRTLGFVRTSDVWPTREFSIAGRQGLSHFFHLVDLLEHDFKHCLSVITNQHTS